MWDEWRRGTSTILWEGVMKLGQIVLRTPVLECEDLLTLKNYNSKDIPGFPIGWVGRIAMQSSRSAGCGVIPSAVLNGLVFWFGPLSRPHYFGSSGTLFAKAGVDIVLVACDSKPVITNVYCRVKRNQTCYTTIVMTHAPVFWNSFQWSPVIHASMLKYNINKVFYIVADRPEMFHDLGSKPCKAGGRLVYSLCKRYTLHLHENGVENGEQFTRPCWRIRLDFLAQL